MGNPVRLELQIFQGYNALPVLDKVEADFEHGREEFSLTKEDQAILLARPESAWLRDRGGATQDIHYKKIRESGQPSHNPSVPGATLYVTYELIKNP